jgi:formate dehydrogenase iron-sulfur subunit
MNASAKPLTATHSQLASRSDAIGDHVSLVDLLLREQHELSAVESFSEWHQNHEFQSSTYKALMPSAAPRAGEQYAFEVDLDACSGCKACVVACHNLNGLEEKETWRKVGLLSSVSQSSLPIVQHTTTACHHCVDPGCLNGCPVKAYEKDLITGIVKHLDDQCFGCKYCTMMCPYEVPQYSKKLGIVRKCDMCSQRLKNDEAPACVQACPNQAIRITIVKSVDLGKEIGDRSITKSLLPTAPASHITVPTTRYVSKRVWSDTEQVQSTESASDHAHEAHLPLVAMLVLTQASVGMWCVIALLSLLSSRSFESTFTTGLVITATGLGLLGINAATLHLGRPWLAFRGFLGWRTSWLSREAIVFGGYIGATLTATAYWYLFDGLDSIGLLLSTATAGLGAIGVACSAMIYVATKRELWNLPRSGVDFGLTAVGLGGLGAQCFMSDTRWLGLAGSIAVAGALSVKWFDLQKGMQPSDVSFQARTGRLVRHELWSRWMACSALFAICVFLSLVGVFLPTGSRVAFAVSGIAFIAALGAALFHRGIYFSSIVYSRMPGAST